MTIEPDLPKAPDSEPTTSGSTTQNGDEAIPAPSSDEDDEDFISEEKLRNMNRSDLIDLAVDAGLDKEWCLNSASNQVVDKLIAEFGV